MAFYDNYVNLCAINRISPSAASEQMKLSRGAVSRWKEGAIPNYATLARIANFFDVDIKTLAEGEIKCVSGGNNEFALTSVERQLVEAWRESDNTTKENIAFLLRKQGFKYGE